MRAVCAVRAVWIFARSVSDASGVVSTFSRMVSGSGKTTSSVPGASGSAAGTPSSIEDWTFESRSEYWPGS